MLLLVSNPCCGSGTGHQFVQSSVLPLLSEHGLTPDEVIVTNDVNSAREKVLNRIMGGNENEVSIIVSGGDGTVHDIVNALYSALAKKQHENDLGRRVNFALVPAGTANALYSSLFPPVSDEDVSNPSLAYKLQSIRALFAQTTPTPLTVARTSVYAPNSGSPTTQIYSIVVTSTALHASILHDSDALRAEIPGVDRFKVAAQMNATRWYDAQATFRAHSGAEPGALRVYNAKKRDFDPVSGNDNQLTLAGPFVYFLSTVNVDRLEPKFEIAPLQRKKREEESAIATGPVTESPSVDDGNMDNLTLSRNLSTSASMSTTSTVPASKRDSMDVIVIRPCKARRTGHSDKDKANSTISRTLDQTPESAETRLVAVDGNIGASGDSSGLDSDFVTTPEQFAAVTMSALMAAYQHGAHVDLVYDEEGKAKLGGEGENVVEYIRCGAWEWVPNETKGDEMSGLICSDGTILRVERGGKAVCEVVRTGGRDLDGLSIEFYIYA